MEMIKMILSWWYSMIHLTCNITNLYCSARWHDRELCHSLFERVFICIYAIPHPETYLWCQFRHFHIQNEVSHSHKFSKKIFLSKSPRRSGLWRGALSGCQPRSDGILSKSSSGYKESNLRLFHQNAFKCILKSFDRNRPDWNRPNRGRPAHGSHTRKHQVPWQLPYCRFEQYLHSESQYQPLL